MTDTTVGEDPTVILLDASPVAVVVTDDIQPVIVVGIQDGAAPTIVHVESNDETLIDIPNGQDPAHVIVEPESSTEIVFSPPEEDAQILVLPGAVKGDRGDSAYEQALSAGFVGTLEDWLNSLVGPAGGTPETLAYEHIQSVPSRVWLVNHNLPFQPGGISTFDSAGSQIVGEVRILDAQTVQINFSSGFSGIARLS